MKDKLGEKIDADYRHWNLPAHVIIFDEYSSFAAVLASMIYFGRARAATKTQ